ncbi:hypothetical protein P9112_003588 [Eukaryota sp. TZLM1-RC]
MDLEQRIQHIESLLEEPAASTLSFALHKGLTTARLHRCPSDYYDWPLSQRQSYLNAPSIDHLCKTLLMVNTRCIYDDCSHPHNSKYYAIVVQYTERMNSAMLHEFLKSFPENEGLSTVKAFNLRLMSDEEAFELTGCGYNAVSPFGLMYKDHDIPIILAKSVKDLIGHVYIGGGEVDVKLSMCPLQFAKVMSALVGEVTIPRED